MCPAATCSDDVSEAAYAGRPGNAPMGGCVVGEAWCFPVWAVLTKMLCMGRRVVWRCTGLGLRGHWAGGGLLRMLLAKTLAIYRICQQPVPLITARDAVRSQKVGDAKMKEDRRVRSLVTRRCQTCVAAV